MSTFGSVSRVLFQRLSELNSRSLFCLGRRFKGHRINPQTGRGSSYGALPKNNERFKFALLKKFTRVEMNLYGAEMGLEDMKIMMESRGHVFRRLDEKKRKQLISLFYEHICSLVALEEDICKYRVTVTKIELPRVMNEILIYWRCFGDERDDEVTELFKTCGPKIWRKFADIFGEPTTARLKFIGDRTHLIEDEMNKLFELADYGMDYRAVSRAAAVLGSMKNDPNETVEEKANKVPRWIEFRRAKRLQKEEQKSEVD